MKALLPCNSAANGVHEFDRKNHMRDTPCIHCGEPRDTLIIQAIPFTIAEIVSLQIKGLTDSERNKRPATIAILISKRVYGPHKDKVEQIRAEVIKQLTRESQHAES